MAKDTTIDFGGKVAIVSGGNIDPKLLASLLS